jgi:hypothetical protein
VERVELASEMIELLGGQTRERALRLALEGAAGERVVRRVGLCEGD